MSNPAFAKAAPRALLVRRAGVVLVCAVVALAFAEPVLRDSGNWGIQDWDQHLFHHAVPRATILDHHQFPLWNPYNRSGVPLLANPEQRVLSPSFALTLAFGELVGLKLEIVLFLVLGMLGAYALLRHYGVGSVASLAAGFLFMLNSWYALHLTVGQTWALNSALIPWAFLCYRKAIDDLRYSFPTSLVLVGMILGGGVYPLMMTLALFGIHSLASVALARRGAALHARLLAAIAIQTLLLGAVKLFPMIELMSAYPRLTDPETGFTVPALWNALFDRDQALLPAFAERPDEFNSTGMHEGLYIGLLALLPFAIGVARGWRRHPELLVSLLLVLWIALGSQVPVSLWQALHLLPGFDNMHVVQRFGIVLVLLVAILAGFGVDALGERVRRATSSPAAGQAAAALLTFLLLADLVVVNSRIFRDAFPIKPLQVEVSREFFQDVRKSGYDRFGWITPNSNPLLSTTIGMYPSFLSNLGSTWGYEIVPVPSNAAARGQKAYRGEAYLSGARGRAAIREWSPNRLLLEIDASGSGHVVVNQNCGRGWRASVGAADERSPRDVVEVGGLLAVPVTPEDREIELRYRPASFVAGALVTPVSLVGGWWFWRRAGRARREAAA